MRAALKIILWVGTILFGILAILMMSGALDGPGQDAAGRGMSAGFGFLIGLVAVAGAVALLLAQKWRGWLIVAGIIIGLPLVLAIVGLIGSGVGQMKQRRYQRQLHSGEIDFGDQPQLLAVALAIDRNDESAIRSAAKAVPNLQATNKDGKTLLYFAVDEAIERPELVKAVQTLLSLGADPNYTNEHYESYALAQSTHGPLALLKAMLDAGGNPNAKDSQGKPIIFGLWATTLSQIRVPGPRPSTKNPSRPARSSARRVDAIRSRRVLQNLQPDTSPLPLVSSATSISLRNDGDSNEILRCRHRIGGTPSEGGQALAGSPSASRPFRSRRRLPNVRWPCSSRGQLDSSRSQHSSRPLPSGSSR